MKAPPKALTKDLSKFPARLLTGYPRYMAFIAVCSIFSLLAFKTTPEQSFLGAAGLGLVLELVAERVLAQRRAQQTRAWLEQDSVR
ncbi:hypothetical protein IQ241_17265 [Romeria aff. gracilis LEGE 07310]|uniref:Uncharacterized protein n=1 Tax=Vasconcelosia minhoensis LEGE 07310 TaxID=915328 RepID=A0A8J7DP34_9CYAN|nr:hypothetical protein [Romeria gracilis]MBE9079025.1 hypothetical protein [Romeria aff. gracilis LEGE 07310]